MNWFTKWFTPNPKHREPNLIPITAEQRELIKRYFRTWNADEKWASSGEYVLPYNVHAGYSRCHLSFFSDDGILKVSIAWYRNPAERGMNGRPLIHTMATVNTPEEMATMKSDIGKGWMDESGRPLTSEYST